MSAINLVILGILKKQRMSAYEMNKHIDYIRLKQWMKIGSPTIYQNLKKLAAKGYLATKIVKDSNMPEKVIYTITDAGNTHFYELMIRFSKTPSPILFDFNAFLFNLDLVDKDSGVVMLKDLKKYFQDSHVNLKKDKKMLKNIPIGAKALIEQYDQLFNTMIQWSDNFLKEYQKMSFDDKTHQK